LLIINSDVPLIVEAYILALECAIQGLIP